MNTLNKSGHINEEALSLYVDALMLDNIEIIPEQVIAHVENCTRCKKEIIEVIDMMKEAKTHTEHIQIPDTKFKHKNKTGRSLATILLLLGLGYIFMNLITINSNESNLRQDDNLIIGIPNPIVEMDYTADLEAIVQPEEQPVKKAKSRKAKKTRTNHYHESYNLESLVETNFRSNSIKVIAPKITQHYQSKQRVTFNFVNTLDQTLFIKILNNKEENVFTTDFTGNSYQMNRNLEAGLYYWKLETEDDLLYVGKFTIR
ncbi:hypothetical protein ACFL6I_22485 [candidate division KSB1 bacterium]